MKRIAIVVGHPRTGTYCEALGKQYMEGASTAGHEAKLFLLGSMDFDPVLHYGFEKAQQLEADLLAAHDAIRAADHVVIIFPLWFGDMPALMKGFLERILQPHMIAPQEKVSFIPLVNGKSARVIITMGMPDLLYRTWYGSYSLRVLRRLILRRMGVAHIRATTFGRINTVALEARQRWLQQVDELGRFAS